MTSTSYSVPSFISMFRSSGRRRKNSITSNQLNIQRIVTSILVLADETWPEGKKNNGSLGSRLDRVHLRISKSKFQVSRRLSCATDAFAINRLLISGEKGRLKSAASNSSQSFKPPGGETSPKRYHVTSSTASGFFRSLNHRPSRSKTYKNKLF